MLDDDINHDAKSYVIDSIHEALHDVLREDIDKAIAELRESLSHFQRLVDERPPSERVVEVDATSGDTVFGKQR